MTWPYESEPYWRPWKKLDGRKPPVDQEGRIVEGWQLAPFMTLEQARAVVAAGKADGVGLVWVARDGMPTWVDVDGCLGEGGEVLPAAEPIVEAARRAGCYVEVSPSGRGLHVLGRGISSRREVSFKSDPRGVAGELGLFLTVTNRPLDPEKPGDPEAPVDALLAEVRERYSPAEPEAPRAERPRSNAALPPDGGAVPLGDQDRWLHSRAGKYRHDGMTEAEIEEHLMIDVRHCPPAGAPWSEADARRHARQVAKHPAGDEDVRATVEDFWFFAVAATYIHAPDGSQWPATSVNAEVSPVPAGLDDKGKPVAMPAAIWIAHNRLVEQMTWYPGMEQVVRDVLLVKGEAIPRAGARVFNLYRPPTLRHGDPSQAGPWLDLVRRLFPEDHEHLTRWFAHRVQRPGEKVNHAIVLGGGQGIGKDSVVEPVVAAVGPWNVANIRPADTMSEFNPFVKSVVVRVSELRDLGEMDRQSFYEHMKTYICAPPATHTCNEKHLRQYDVPNVCGVVMTTNHADALYLAEDDRRHFVAWSEAKREDCTKEQWTAYYRWLAEGGSGHVAAYLAAVDLSGFDPKAPPPRTSGFHAMLHAARSGSGDDLLDAVEALKNPAALTVDDVERVANADLRNLIQDRKTSPRTVGKLIEKAGYRVVRNPDAKSGRWHVEGAGRVTVYVRKDIVSERAQFEAVKAYTPGVQASIPGAEL